jgi:hypothetical protein
VEILQLYAVDDPKEAVNDQGRMIQNPSLERTILFEHQLLEHEVLKMNKGLRLSITEWLRTA